MINSKFTRFFVATLSCLTLLAMSGAESLDKKTKADVLASIKDVIEHKAYVPNVDFSRWDKNIASEQGAIKKAKTDDEFAFAVQNALSSFGISHAYILTPQAVALRQDHSVTGIGVQIFPEKDDVLIVKVFPGSPAEKGGLLAGDKVLTVEDSTKDMINRIRGKEGTTVNLVVLHPDGAKSHYSFVRRKFDTTIPATLDVKDGKVAVVTIPTFDLTYSSSNVSSLMDQARKYPEMIVDLRSNPGGSVLNMLQFLGLVLPADSKIGAMIGRPEVKAYQKDHPGKVDVVEVAKSVSNDNILRPMESNSNYYKGHIVVLVNQGSGSAAEIAAAALHEVRGATIIGEKSAGAVLVSVIDKAADGFMIQFPLFDYVTSGGIRLEGHGVVPDVTVPDPTVPGLTSDGQLTKAISIVEAEDKAMQATSKQADNSGK